MIVMSFDLSTVCIGIITAEVKGNKVTKMASAPIFPEPFDASTLGFMKSKKSLPLSVGEGRLNTWWKKGEESITKKEKKRRDKLVRDRKNLFLLTQISEKIGKLIDVIDPDLVLVERNETFNGILTTELLAKLMGTLVGILGIKGIPMKEFNSGTARKILNVPELLRDFAKDHSEEVLMSVPDVTKRAIRNHLQDKYDYTGVDLTTDDEGDALAVFNYWFEEEYNV